LFHISSSALRLLCGPVASRSRVNTNASCGIVIVTWLQSVSRCRLVGSYGFHVPVSSISRRIETGSVAMAAFSNSVLPKNSPGQYAFGKLSLMPFVPAAILRLLPASCFLLCSDASIFARLRLPVDMPAAAFARRVLPCRRGDHAACDEAGETHGIGLLLLERRAADAAGRLLQHVDAEGGQLDLRVDEVLGQPVHVDGA